ncbi:MAG: hypothetical protein M3464_17235 [Chloroflexota bacterium]|nr:hypothetical protein [Chloroflexota bacterium]
MHRFILFPLALAVIVVGIASTRGADAVDPRLTGYPELRFRLTEERIIAPAEIAAGRVRLVEESEGPLAGHAFVLRVPDDVSDEELAATLANDGSAAEETPAWFYQAWFVGNGDRAMVNRPAIGLVDLKPGRYVIGDPFRPGTEFAVFDAVDTANGTPVATAEVQADVAIDLFEMDFNIPDDVVAGRQIWEVTNTGAMLHEIAIFPVPAGVAKERVVEAVLAGGEAAFGVETTPEMIAAMDAVGPEWADWTLDLAGGVGVLSPQAVSWAQLDLEPGTYAAVCFIPGPDGTPHFLTGMTTVFDVAAAAN